MTRAVDRLSRRCDTRPNSDMSPRKRVCDEVRAVHGDPASPREDAGEDVRRGARADRERRSPGLRRLRGDRALLLPGVLDLCEPDGAVRRRRAANAAGSVSGRCCTRFRTGIRRCWPRRSPSWTSSRVAATSSGSWPRLASREGGGVPLDEHARPRYEEAVDLLFLCSARERAVLARRRVLPRRRLARRAVPDSEVRVTSVERRTGRTSSRPSTAQTSPSRRCCPTSRWRSSSISIGSAAPGTGRRRTSSGSTCHLDEDRDTALREARDWTVGFIKGNCSPLIEYEKPSTEGLLKADYGFYTAGIMEQLNEIPYEQLIEEDYIWVGTPDDIIERIEQTLESARASARSRSRSTPAESSTGWRSRTRSSSRRAWPALRFPRHSGARGGHGVVREQEGRSRRTS